MKHRVPDLLLDENLEGLPAQVSKFNQYVPQALPFTCSLLEIERFFDLLFGNHSRFDEALAKRRSFPVVSCEEHVPVTKTDISLRIIIDDVESAVLLPKM